jgi:hypothetical protein
LAIRKFTSQNREQREVGPSDYKLVVDRTVDVLLKRVRNDFEDYRAMN